MSTPARVWLVLALLYALFFSWYTSFGGPLSQAEIAHFSQVLEDVASPPERMRTWVAFMESDTGDDFAMLNAIHFRDTPTRVPGVEPGDTSQDVMAKYALPFLGKALLKAAHPVMLGTAAAAPMDIWGIDGADEWSQGGLVRYRSRRDLMEHVEALRDSMREQADSPIHIHDFKIAAIEKTIAYPLDPWYQLGDPRFVLALLFVIVGLSAQVGWGRRV